MAVPVNDCFSHRFSASSSVDEIPSQCVLDWNFDTIAVCEFSGKKPIQFVTGQIWTLNPQLSSEFGACVKILQEVFAIADTNYNPWATLEGRLVTFHNASHGADVTQAMYYMLRGPPNILHALSPFIALSKQKESLVLISVIFASAMHDFDHPGWNNDFLTKSGNLLIEEYAGESVLEQYHCAKSFALLESLGFSRHLSKSEFAFFKSLVTDMVLSTDLAHHFESMSHPLLLEDYRECLCTLMHAADVSNVARPGYISCKWTDLILEEFFSQGDLEKHLNLAVSPIMDRENANMARIQQGFIDVIARPLFVKLSTLFDLRLWLKQLEKNRT